MCKVYTDVGGIKVGGIKELYHVCPPVRKITHSLKLVDYLHVQADNPWYNYYLFLVNRTELYWILEMCPGDTDTSAVEKICIFSQSKIT